MFLLFSPAPVNGEASSVQQQIDAARPGETVKLAEGTYEERIIIDKPLHLVGAGDVTLVHTGAGPSITIKADHVRIENLNMIHENSGSPAILMTGNHNVLDHINIYTNSQGIRLEEAHHNTISRVSIEGDKWASFTERQHGFDLWRSNYNQLYANQVQYVRDGIYIERSIANLIRNNSVSHSRYGYHLMFTEKTILEENQAYENISGMMIMGTAGTAAKHNMLFNNQQNVRSLGLLLFDVKDAVISHNHILYNRVGIFIEDSRENELTQNNVHGNYIGLQFKKAADNEIHHNAFTANVVQGQAEESHNNDVHHNFWGDHAGLDLTGDETSDLPYRVDPYFLQITDEYPPFQLFFHSPGLIFLEQLIHTPADRQFTDEAPLLENPLNEPEDQSTNPVASVVLSLLSLFLSSTIIFLGVKSG